VRLIYYLGQRKLKHRKKNSRFLALQTRNNPCISSVLPYKALFSSVIEQIRYTDTNPINISMEKS